MENVARGGALLPSSSSFFPAISLVSKIHRVIKRERLRQTLQYGSKTALIDFPQLHTCGSGCELAMTQRPIYSADHRGPSIPIPGTGSFALTYGQGRILGLGDGAVTIA